MTESDKTTESLADCRGRTLLKEYLSAHFDATLIKKFDALTEIYMQVNAVINISALKTPDDIYIKHYLDSIAAYEFFYGDCCDVGCGGGFPCLPLAIVAQHNYLGIDGVGKKLTLINRCAEKLGLTNIRSMHARAEELKSLKKFDTVCARAVADADKVLGYCAPLCKAGGKIVLYKTQSDDKATEKAVRKNKCSLYTVKDYTLHGTDIKRRLFVYVHDA